MKILFAAGTVIFFASQFLCKVYAIELCEPQDYYNLADSTECKIKSSEAGEKSDSREPMFEILKNYPYEKKDKFIKLLQKKVELVEDYLIQQQGKRHAERIKANISTLERTKRDLSEQLEKVSAATQNKWIKVRDRARKALEEATNRLREVD
jgi:hypothetical protein